MSEIIWHKELDSTNNEVRRRVNELDNMSVTAALCQSAGRGQGDHRWTARPGKNLTFTILWKPEDLDVKDALCITRVTTLSLLSYLRSKGVEARIKWPNDIYVGNKKICGILIETLLDGSRIKDALVGIGLNINEDEWPSFLPNPVSLKELTGVSYDLEAELVLYHKEFCRHALMISSPDGRKYLQEEFDKKVFRLSEEQ